MRQLTVSKPTIAVLAGLTLAGALAGCAPTADPAPTAAETTDPTTAPTDTATEAPAGASAYKDGTYSESADYSAPSGTETVDVTLTLEGDVITAVEVAGHATDPEAKVHQAEFASGIAAVVVGKNIDDIQVDKVGGSSLTSGGFNKAVDAIKSDAAA